jgi:preprotein translocase subunit SecG
MSGSGNPLQMGVVVVVVAVVVLVSVVVVVEVSVSVAVVVLVSVAVVVEVSVSVAVVVLVSVTVVSVTVVVLVLVHASWSGNWAAHAFGHSRTTFSPTVASMQSSTSLSQSRASTLPKQFGTVVVGQLLHKTGHTARTCSPMTPSWHNAASSWQN